LQTTFRRPHWKEIGQLGWTTGGGGRIKLLENIDRATKKKQLFVPHWVVPQQDSLAVFNGHPSFWTSVRKNDADVVAIMVADTASLRAFMFDWTFLSSSFSERFIFTSQSQNKSF
jgi:hypothetical protein